MCEQNLMASMAGLMGEMSLYLRNNLGIWYFALYNFFGLISVVVKMIEYQLKSRNITIIFSCIALLSWVFYFGLQGDAASAFATLINAISCLIFLQRDKYKWARSPFWLFFFIGISLYNLFISFQAWHDLFCIFTSVFGVLAYYVRSVKAYRYIALCSESCWLLNSLFKMHIVCLVCDVLGFASVLFAILRIAWAKRNTSVKTKKLNVKL